VNPAPQNGWSGLQNPLFRYVNSGYKLLFSRLPKRAVPSMAGVHWGAFGFAAVLSERFLQPDVCPVTISAKDDDGVNPSDRKRHHDH